MLLDRHGLIIERWTRNSEDQTQPRLVGWDQWAHFANINDPDQIGIEIPNTVSIVLLKDALPQLGLVAIRFASFSDGRGLSLARQIRRSGFKGRIRLVGPLIPDQFSYALQCGVDEIELPETSANRQSEAQWQAAIGAYRLTYQRGYQTGSTILEQRRFAREVQDA
jgi:uncharacterized protein (DUF934 family)